MLSPSAQAVHAKYEARRAQEHATLAASPPGAVFSMRDQLLLSVGPESGRLLHALILGSGATRILELGTSYGYSTLFLADAAAKTGGRVITMDLAADKQAYARSMLEEAGLAGVVDWRTGDAVALVNAERGPFDFVLLDIWKDVYLPCLAAFHPKLAERAIVVADNMLEPAVARPEARAYRAAVAALPDIRSTLLPIGSGLEVSCKWGAGDI
jgi:predicted O-methyltransferase YrrM